MLQETILLKNSVSELKNLRNVISHFATKNNLSQNMINDINLILEEAVINIMHYAYKHDKEPHGISVRLNKRKKVVVCRVEDDGIPFDPLTVAEPKVDATLEERKIGGYGIFLIRKLARSVLYLRNNGKNILTIEVAIK
jgi:serine/threonine-protein kinase RsbW